MVRAVEWREATDLYPVQRLHEDLRYLILHRLWFVDPGRRHSHGYCGSLCTSATSVLRFQRVLGISRRIEGNGASNRIGRRFCFMAG